MRRATLLAGLAVPLLALASGDLLSQLRWSAPSFEDSVFTFVIREGAVQLPGGAGAARALPPDRRAEALRHLFHRAKAYVQSPAFRQRYAAWRAEQAPAAPGKTKTLADVQAQVKKQNDEVDASIKAMEAQMKDLPKEIQAQMKAAISELKKSRQEAPAIPLDQLLEGERHSHAQALRDHQEALKRMPPEDPNRLLKKALQRALAETEGIDHGAALIPGGTVNRFKNPAYEGKSPLWKMGFRAGRETTDTARAFARQWLSELK